MDRPPRYLPKPWIRGRRLHLSDVVPYLREAEGAADEVAAVLDLPPGAVRECAAYYDQHRDQVEADLREAAAQARQSIEAPPR